MDLLPWVLSSGWASGVNAYAVVMLLGLAGRLGGVDGVPPGLQSTGVLVAAIVMFVVELVADKVPYVDSVWDSVHTFVRPAIGAIVAGLLAGQIHDLHGATQVGVATLGGATALASHLVKAGLRGAVNTSPEPASNIAVSAAEDLTVGGVIAILLVHPWVAAGIAMTLLVTGLVIVIVLWRTIRRAQEARRERREARLRRATVVPDA